MHSTPVHAAWQSSCNCNLVKSELQMLQKLYSCLRKCSALAPKVFIASYSVWALASYHKGRFQVHAVSQRTISSRCMIVKSKTCSAPKLAQLSGSLRTNFDNHELTSVHCPMLAKSGVEATEDTLPRLLDLLPAAFPRTHFLGCCWPCCLGCWTN